MAKYSYEQKLECVLKVTEEHMSCLQASRWLGTGVEHVRRWVKRYEEFGEKGLLLKHGSYTGQFKIDVIEYMHTNNLSINETAVKFGIPSDTTLGKWVRIYYEEGAQALYRDNRGKSKMAKPKKHKITKATDEDLATEVQRLRMEVDYLKKLNALILEKEKSAKGTKHK